MAFCAMRGSPGAKAYYQQLGARTIGHQAALRQLANHLVGILHGCLKTRTRHNENTAWGTPHNSRRLTSKNLGRGEPHQRTKLPNLRMLLGAASWHSGLSAI
jgi:hypothetical protein